MFAASAKTPDSNNHEHNGFIGWTLGYSTSLQPHQPFLGKVRHPCIGAYCRVLEGDRTDSETGSVTDSVTGCGRGDGRGFIKNVLLERMQSAEVGGAFQSTGFLQYSTAGQGGRGGRLREREKTTTDRWRREGWTEMDINLTAVLWTRPERERREDKDRELKERMQVLNKCNVM